MEQGTLATEKAIRIYLAVLNRAILDLRMRIRYAEPVEMQEVHDLLDAIHNIPEMLCAYGGWHVEENINQDLLRYDSRRRHDASELTPCSLMKALEEAAASIQSK